MFTSWEQVRAWIEDNNFPHWIFYKNNPETRIDDKANDKIIDSNMFVVSDMQDKLAMTEKYLRMYGGKVYGVGFKTPNATQGGIVCEARLDMDMPQTSSVGNVHEAFNIGELRDSIAREIRAQIKAEQYEQERANFEKEKAAFEQEKQTALGALVHYFAPIGQMLLQKKVSTMAGVAGVDVEEPVHAQPIQTIETEEDMHEEIFTDQEADKLFELMARFKKVEPNYLQLIESVVKMAESGDSTYTMAKGFLLK